MDHPIFDTGDRVQTDAARITPGIAWGGQLVKGFVKRANVSAGPYGSSTRYTVLWDDGRTTEHGPGELEAKHP